MKAGFTGSRSGMTTAQARMFAQLMRELRPDEFHHGDDRGADSRAHDVYSMVVAGPRVIVHPSTIEERRAYRHGAEVRDPKPPLKRNVDITEETDVLIAAPNLDHEITRSGTWATVRYARRLDRPTAIIWPDGSVGYEGEWKT